MNLYEETVEKLETHGKSFNDVIAICGNSFQISKEAFVRLSKTEYDNDYGAPEVATDLVIVGAGWWLERNEYDGAEWWDFKQMPKYKELPFKNITALTIRQAWENGVECSCGWETLDELNPCGNEKDGEQG